MPSSYRVVRTARQKTICVFSIFIFVFVRFPDVAADRFKIFEGIDISHTFMVGHVIGVRVSIGVFYRYFLYFFREIPCEIIKRQRRKTRTSLSVAKIKLRKEKPIHSSDDRLQGQLESSVSSETTTGMTK